MNTIIELMLAIRKRTIIFYHKDTNEFDDLPVSKNEFQKLNPNKKLPKTDRNNFRLPSYEEIDHKEIMRFYVREYVEDKENRKQLFGILRRTDYMDAYLQKLHELNLYDDFIDACGDIYIQLFEEWADRNNLDFK